MNSPKYPKEKQIRVQSIATLPHMPLVVECRVSGQPLSWHKMEVKKVYVINGEGKPVVFTICKEHNQEILVPIPI